MFPPFGVTVELYNLITNESFSWMKRFTQLILMHPKIIQYVAFLVRPRYIPVLFDSMQCCRVFLFKEN